MKFAVISPVPLLSRYAVVSNYHMALTHLVLESQKYQEFYQARKAKGDYVILDNSLIEMGSAMDMEKVLRAAEMIGADEIILPDAYQDMQGTLDMVQDTIKHYDADLAKYKIMAVAQGANSDEWLQCYKELACCESVDVIGIPKNTSSFKDISNGRYGLCMHMACHDLVSTEVEHHLLGVWNNPLELAYLSAYKWIRGVDTVLPVLMGTMGIAFDAADGLKLTRPKRVVDFHSSFDPYPEIVEANIFKMLRWCSR